MHACLPALSPLARPRAQPPRLALVLGSGGVRSAAALGVHAVLVRAGLTPDLVVGCSSGALFGATISMGLRSAEALQLATGLWTQELTQQRRWRAYAQLVAPRLTRFDEDFALRDDALIRRRLETAFGGLHLEDLAPPLRVVATDAANGASVVLGRGALVPALRASIAVPLIFPGVTIDGRRLVDGVISDPLPIAAARDARTVVALGFEGGMPRRVDRVSRLVGRTTTAMINNLQRARFEAERAAGRNVVSIELAADRRIGLWETRAISHLFEAGQRAAEAQLAQIEAAAQRGSADRQAA